jgi:MFS family permease
MTAVDGADVRARRTEAKGPNLLRPLRVRDFRLLFGGESVSVLGDYFHFVALAWLTLQLTGSGPALGSVLMVAAIPRAVFVLLGGALSDRFSPRSLMLYSNAFRGVVVGILAVLVLTGTAELWHLFIFAGIFGVVDALFYPAVNTILPMLVDEETLPQPMR